MLKNYLIITIKVLSRRKFFTFVSLFGISITLMTLIVATSFLDHSFSSKDTDAKFDRVLTAIDFRMRSPDKQSNWNSAASYALLNRYIKPLEKKHPDIIEAISYYSYSEYNSLFHKGEKIPFQTKYTDESFFKIIQLRFLEGNPFTQEDLASGAYVAVINQRLKEKVFNGEPALGKTLVFRSRTYKVIGVVENVPEISGTAYADVWVPLSNNPGFVSNTLEINQNLLGELSCAFLATDEKYLPQIKLLVKEAIGSIDFPDPKEFNLIETVPRTKFEHAAADIFWDWETHFSKDESQKLRWIIIGAAILFMLLPSLNLINLNLSRMMERASEIGVRRAFGASVPTLVNQFLVENIFLSLTGGVIGVLMSFLAIYILNSSNMYMNAAFEINMKVLTVGFVMSILFGVLSGVYPAWKMAKLHPVNALKGNYK